MQQTMGRTGWDDVKSDYDGGALSVAQVCSRHGVSLSQLYRRIRRDGWRKRAEVASAWGPESGIPKAMLTRLRNTISRRIRVVEQRSLKAARGETALESERQARAIAALVKALEQVVALERRLSPVNADPMNDNEGDDAAWRSKLAETLGQMFGSDADRGVAEIPARQGGAPEHEQLGSDSAQGPASANRG